MSIKNKQIGLYFILAFALAFIFSLNLISSTGCCFNPSTGQCLMGSDLESCEANGGTPSASCNTADCNIGCCIRGGAGEMTTSRRCELLSGGTELGINWRQGESEEECANVATAQQFGACLTGQYQPYKCIYKSAESCSSTKFTPGVFCTNPQLNTTSKTTTNTMCWPENNGSVYGGDSTGNPDGLKETCDITQGKICKQETSSSAKCVSVNCEVTLKDSKGKTSVVTKKNGDSWCALDSITTLDGGKDFNMLAFYKSSNVNRIKVGSRFMRYYCLNGVINSDPCSDFKTQICEQVDASNAKCVENNYQECMDVAGGDDSANIGACPAPNCIFTADDPPCGRVGPDSSQDTKDKMVKIIQENFNEYAKKLYLDGNSLAPMAEVAFCNIGTEIVNVNAHPEIATGGPDDKEFYPAMQQDLFAKKTEKGNSLGVCAPLIAPGYNFWGSSSGSSSSSTSSNAFCSLGDFHATATFKYKDCCRNDGAADFWYLELDSSSDDKYGWAGLFDMNPSHWTDTTTYDYHEIDPNTPNGGISPEECSNRSDTYYQTRCVSQTNRLYFYGNFWTSNNPLASFFKNIKEADGIVKIPINPYIVDWLQRKCSGWVGDCGGKGNWKGVSGSGGTDGKWDTSNVASRNYQAVTTPTENIGDYTDYSGQAMRGDGTNCDQLNNKITDVGVSALLKDCKSYTSNYANGSSYSQCNCGYYVKTSDVAAEKENAPLENTSPYTIDCKKNGDTVTCPIDFTCSSWKAPKGSEKCGECGKDGVPCSEYRCRSLGQQCEYKNLDGEDQAFCVATTDHTNPTITSKSYPTAPVAPWTSVTINVTTSEQAHCKFSMNDGGGANYEGMKFDFTTGYGTEHFVELTLPGKMLENDNDIKQYGLIQGGGNYSMYIRCQDTAGNSPDGYDVIRFKVMQTPEYVPAVIKNMTPVSGSRVKAGLTEKIIRFQLNEPATCKWDFTDKNYSSMASEFSCDSLPSDFGATNGYWCSGTLTNITTNLTGQSKYYIRCKDNPQFEGKENNLYKRNENLIGKEYILRASEELTIVSVSPVGLKKITGENLSVDIKVTTSNGAFNGQSVCRWSIKSSPLQKFATTGSSYHSQTLTSPELGENMVRIKCEDSAGNMIEINSSFNLEIDRTTPIINRIFSDKGLLKIKTDENSVCYLSFDKKLKCAFKILNATLMAGVEKEHTTEWKEDKTYYVKCKDYFGNEDSSCNRQIRTF